MNAAVGLLHEGVEVDAAFACDVGVLEEQVHEHGFPAADVADEIEAAAGFGGFDDGAPPPEAADPSTRGARGRRVVAAKLDP